MKFFRKMYQKSGEQGGFTLVEMIVVLVIIAILAAITIPALLKYIDKARDKQVLIDTRAICMATQSVMTEAYATDSWKNNGKNFLTIGDKNGNDEQKKQYEEIINLSGVATLQNGGSFGAYVTDNGEVSVIVYCNGNGKIGTYFKESDEYEIYDETDFTEFTESGAWHTRHKNKVYYFPYKDSKGNINELVSKSGFYVTFGYKNK